VEPPHRHSPRSRAQTLLRTAFSPIVRECGDLSAGVFDLQGRMLAQAVTGTPGHINSMAVSVGHFIDAFPLPTDVRGRCLHHQRSWMGTGHRNDGVVTTPVFHRGRLVALFSCTSHLTDIGGIGFGPDATDVYMEALGIPFLKLFDRGVRNETLIAIVKDNTRLPVECEGDLYSLANCNEIGARRLVEMLEEFGLADIEGLASHVVETSRAAVLAAIRKLPNGSWINAMTVDGYDEPVTLAAKLTISGEGHRRRLWRGRPRSRGAVSTFGDLQPPPIRCSGWRARWCRRCRAIAGSPSPRSP